MVDKGPQHQPISNNPKIRGALANLSNDQKRERLLLCLLAAALHHNKQAEESPEKIDSESWDAIVELTNQLEPLGNQKLTHRPSPTVTPENNAPTPQLQSSKKQQGWIQAGRRTREIQRITRLIKQTNLKGKKASDLSNELNIDLEYLANGYLTLENLDATATSKIVWPAPASVFQQLETKADDEGRSYGLGFNGVKFEPDLLRTYVERISEALNEPDQTPSPQAPSPS